MSQAPVAPRAVYVVPFLSCDVCRRAKYDRITTNIFFRPVAFEREEEREEEDCSALPQSAYLRNTGNMVDFLSSVSMFGKLP